MPVEVKTHATVHSRSMYRCRKRYIGHLMCRLEETERVNYEISCKAEKNEDFRNTNGYEWLKQQVCFSVQIFLILKIVS